MILYYDGAIEMCREIKSFQLELKTLLKLLIEKF